MYSLLAALIIGLEFMGFTLFLVSSFSIGLWAYLGNHRGILYFKFYDRGNHRNVALVLGVGTDAH